MRLSTGNQLLGKVEKIKKGAVSVLVSINIDGRIITSDISYKAYDKLNIKEGMAGFAILKSTDVMIGLDPLNISARNKLPCLITDIDKGTINATVTMKLSDENNIYSVITNDSLDALDIHEGNEVFAIFKASSVIVAC